METRMIAVCGHDRAAMDSCSTIQDFFTQVPDAKANLEELRFGR